MKMRFEPMSCGRAASVVLVLGIQACTEGSVPTPTIPNVSIVTPVVNAESCGRELVLEAEQGAGGQRQSRSEASNQATRWLRRGEELTIGFQVPSPARCEVSVRYSNDNANDAPTETITLLIDNAMVGLFVSEDTSGPRTPAGGGWNIFRDASAGAVLLGSGRHTLVVTSTGGDAFGFEVDAIRIH
jgi:hypothetical protein